MTLREAYELIKDEEHWTQGVYARDARGYSTDAFGSDAEQWCLLGATGKTHCSTMEIGMLHQVASELFPESVHQVHLAPAAWVNDHIGHEAALQLLEKALVQEEGSL